MTRINASSPNSDENRISLYIVATYSDILVMRISIKEVMTKDKMSLYLDKLASREVYGEQKGEYAFFVRA